MVCPLSGFCTSREVPSMAARVPDAPGIVVPLGEEGLWAGALVPVFVVALVVADPPPHAARATAQAARTGSPTK